VQGLQNPLVVGAPVAKPHLLVVDDDRELCQLISRYLEDEGFLSTAVLPELTGRELQLQAAFSSSCWM
jgi:CheY-like chemotaxis protein